MARGWESKSIESQQDLARERQNAPQQTLSDQQKKQLREREALLLSRARVMQQIEASTNERYTKVLRHALAELEQKIASLGGS